MSDRVQRIAYSTTDAAQAVGRSSSWIWEQIKKGRLRYNRETRLIPASDVEALALPAETLQIDHELDADLRGM